MTTNKLKTGLILLFNPHQEDFTFLRDMLNREGYNFKTIREESEFLSIIEYEPVALILINSYVAGQKLCQKIKEKENYKKIPVLFILPENELFATEKIFKIGGADYIPYPYKKEEILARVENQVSLNKLIKENKKLKEAWEKASIQVNKFTTIDSLTNLANRRQLEEYLHKEWLRCARERVDFGDAEKTTISLIIVDLDYFNVYNDQYGYELGDNCLKMVAETIKETVRRPADLVARYDGSKLAILLPNTDDMGGVQVAKILKAKIENLKINHAFSPIGEYLTISMGIASAIPSQALSTEVLIGAAERALFEAKAQGGNRIIGDNF